MENPTTMELQTYRFSFEKEFADELYSFSKIHQFDDRKSFKEAWIKWIDDVDINSLINLEIKRLNNSGYVGDIMDKMFKSARYYYRKKSPTPKEQPERKKYVGFPKDLLANMDDDIKHQIAFNYMKNTEDDKVIEISPSEAFDHYCSNNKMVILNELKNITDDSEKITRDDVNKITDRFKKTYKNRFYKIRVQLAGKAENL